MDPVSVRQYDGRIVPTKDPQGRDLFWFTVKPLGPAEEGTDRWAVEQEWISMTRCGSISPTRRSFARSRNAGRWTAHWLRPVVARHILSRSRESGTRRGGRRP